MPVSSQPYRPWFARLMSRRVIVPLAIVALQAIAATYFVVDGIDEVLAEARQGISFGTVMELVVALALLAGIGLGLRHIVNSNRELVRMDRALAGAQGALAEHITLRFQQWRLTPGEAEVALFALKGYEIGEIARLRGAAGGTVRSQLSQVYAKAGVTSQAMLVSLFIEDLLGHELVMPKED